VQNNTIKNNPLEDSLSAYSRALRHHAICAEGYRKHRQPLFHQFLKDAAQNARWWKAYIVKWGKL